MSQKRSKEAQRTGKSAYQNSKAKFSSTIATGPARTFSSAKVSAFAPPQVQARQQLQQKLQAAKSAAPIPAAFSTQSRGIASKPVSRAQQRQITTAAAKSRFESLPNIAGPTGLVSSHLSAANLPHITTLSARDISTIVSPLGSALKQSKNAAVRNLAGMTPVFTPHASSLAQNSIDLVPVFIPLRNFAGAAKDKAAPAAKKKVQKKAPEIEAAEGGEEIFAQAGDVKKNIRNWLEQILTSKPVIYPMPQAAVENEELFVKGMFPNLCESLFVSSVNEEYEYLLCLCVIDNKPTSQ